MTIKKIERELNRREFLRKSAVVAAALPAAGTVLSLWGCDGGKKPGETESDTSPSTPVGAATDLAHVTEYSSNSAVLQALKYVEKSPNAEQTCANCQFYARAADAKSMGKCQLIPQGLVKAEAWCASWQPMAS